MEHLMLGESEELIKKAFGIRDDVKIRAKKNKVERIRKELEKQVKEMLKQKKYA